MNRTNLAIFTALLTIPAIILTIPEIVLAKTPSQIAQLAIPVTVQINSIAGGGSGVIIAQKNDGKNYIYKVLTADHVVKSAALEYSIRTYTGKHYIAISVEHLQKEENDPDLAIVTFSSPQQYPAASLGDSDRVQIGDTIAIFAYPYLDENQSPDQRLFVYSSGDINTVKAKRPNAYDLLYDATTQKGMSGGPVFNQEGKLIGIHGRGERLVNSEEEVQYAFNAAIPINTFLALEPNYKPNIATDNILNTNNINTNNDNEIDALINNVSQTENRYAGASEFYCDLSGTNPQTVARNVINNKIQVLINWQGNYQDNTNWGVSAVKRCQIVSSKFQQAYYENRLEYLTNGFVNNYPVICATTYMDENCNKENMLLTLKPEMNARDWLDKFLQGKPQPVRGKVLFNMAHILSSLSPE